MNLFQALILGAVQGLTEFLPVSSSGHLALIQILMNLKNVPLSFDILLHIGTLFAVLIFLRKELLLIIKGFFTLKKDALILVLKIIIALIPAAIVGYLFNDKIEALFSQPKALGFAYFGTALILFLTVFLKSEKKNIKTITFLDALIVGIFQSLALVPGFSRSGFTLFSALLVGMNKEDALNFSFILSIPAIIGAFIFELLSAEPVGSLYISLGLNISAFIISLITGLIAIYLLRTALKKSKLYLFGLYCLILGIIILMIF